MSWFAHSLANSLRIELDSDDDDDEADEYDDEEIDVEPGRSHVSPTHSPGNHQRYHQRQPHQTQDDEFESDNDAQLRGVKEDLDELKQTLTRQFWGVASFLAPPPTNSHPPSKQTFSDPAALTGNQSEPSDQCASGSGGGIDVHDGVGISCIGRGEIEGRFRNEVPGVSFTASDLSSHGPEYVENGEFEMDEPDLKQAIGITEEVLTFARNIAMHPETWLDFPIDEEEDTADFDMSDAQQEHAFVIERLAPRLAALRIELCPCHMSEGYFWKVYFVLLHSRLNKQDAGVLSTSQVMTARAMWMQELQKQTKPESEWYGRSTSCVRDIAPDEDLPPSISDYTISHVTRGYEPTSWPTGVDYESEKHTIESSETVFTDKSVIEEKPIVKTDDKGLTNDRSSKIAVPNYADGEDEWPEEDSELEGTIIPMVNEDISFSDLEDDDYGIKHVKSKTDPKTV
ncbi:uncharacterized protein LOC114759575 [Neltuma alba]|uniref:uncharacterized protein LOC114759575 n=1 Tax=Neltuma alba TaxID=207710 RepID=UPI0010A53216|nr:uncharacterized protein LOC114759575 [Prosopis alba]